MALDERSKAIYQPWNHEEFCADLRVRRMTPSQRRGYVMLLHEAFFCSTRPYLPDDDDHLALMADCETEDEWGRNKATIRKMFEPFELNGLKLLRHRRVETDWDRLLKKRGVSSDTARNAAQARWEKERRLKEEQSDAARCSEHASASDSMLGDAKEVSKQVSKGSEGKEVSENPNSIPDFEEQEHGHGETDPVQGDEMKAKKEIPHICKHKLGIGAETYANVWEQVAYLEREHGSSAVIRAFEDWCEGKRLDVTSKPVSKFLEQADGILSGVLTSGGASVVLASPEVVGLVDDLVELSDGSVRYNTQQQQQVAVLAKEYSPEEVVSSFRTFFADLKDDFELKMAAKNFVETAGQVIRLARRKKVKQDQITTNLAAQEVEKRREVDAELERVRLEEAEEADLMEDLLPVEVD